MGFSLSIDLMFQIFLWNVFHFHQLAQDLTNGELLICPVHVDTDKHVNHPSQTEL